MAKPIKETPIINGNDVVIFRNLLHKNIYRKLSHSEIEEKKKEIRDREHAYDLMVSISDGTFY